jgi:hypothetical protein
MNFNKEIPIYQAEVCTNLGYYAVPDPGKPEKRPSLTV